MFPLTEPVELAEFMVRANERFVSQPILVKLAPVMADGLPLTFPFILLIRYIWYGIYRKSTTAKKWALLVFFSALVASVMNMIIQLLVDKERPEGYIQNTDFLIMDHLPTDPFPSDHASVGMAFAVAVWLWGRHIQSKKLKNIGRVLILAALVMSATRMSVAIHWPTDVIVGSFIGILVAYLLHLSFHFSRTLWWVMDKLISIEEYVLGVFGMSNTQE